MKTLLIIIMISITSIGYSQEELSVYFPFKTKHTIQHPHIVKGEGGDGGMIVSYSFKKQGIISGGVIRNSFGVNSVLIGGGIYKDLGCYKFVASAGFMSGYRIITMDPHTKFLGLSLPNFMKEPGIAPYMLLTMKIQVYKNLGIQINTGPEYVNCGIYANIF